jgi:beta-N-acetylhexosaminidase
MLNLSEAAIRPLIANMLIVGFDDETITPKSPISRHIETGLGGVILFDRFYDDRERIKNIRNPEQLKRLTAQLQGLSKRPLIIAVDQEGGRVARLKNEAGFGRTPSAEQVAARNDDAYAKREYATLAAILQEAGINCNFAPDVDLRINESNRVIVGLERSYGSDPSVVARFAGIFCDALKRQGIIPVLKHFPGHGSSLEDSHEGFVDVSATWSERELEPYRLLVASGRAEMVMTAHVFNDRLDPDYPATLSRAVNTELLRRKLGFDGVIVSDDLQMQAIASRYSLEETMTLAINAGVDLLLFGNQLARHETDDIIDVICGQVMSGAIHLETVEAANRRIEALKRRYFHTPEKVR